MTAGVHVAVSGCEIQVGFFGDVQGVHVGTQQHSWSWVATANQQCDGGQAFSKGDLTEPG